MREREEREAERALGGSIEVRVRCERQQCELDRLATEAARAVDSSRQASAPRTAAEAGAQDRWRAKLRADAARASGAAQAHRQGPLAQALTDETEARARHQRARQEREAAEALRDRALAEAAALASRRAEDEAGDRANAAYSARKARTPD